jgi:hypothetical protein
MKEPIGLEIKPLIYEGLRLLLIRSNGLHVICQIRKTSGPCQLRDSLSPYSGVPCGSPCGETVEVRLANVRTYLTPFVTADLHLQRHARAEVNGWGFFALCDPTKEVGSAL